MPTFRDRQLAYFFFLSKGLLVQIMVHNLRSAEDVEQIVELQKLVLWWARMGMRHGVVF